MAMVSWADHLAWLRSRPGAYADPDAKRRVWRGDKSREYVAACLAEFGTVCWLCGLPGADSADHIIAIANGGDVYNLDNVNPCHRRCNFARGKRDANTATIPIESGIRFFR